MYKKIVSLATILILVGCNSSRSVIVTSKNQKSNTKRVEANSSSPKAVSTSDLINGYVFHYKDIAMRNMKNFGIPASIILAQGILESGSGQSKLATTANNHFGIKCYKDWTGATSYHDDDASQECFRKYNNPEESYQDHADILSKRTRYASLFKLSKGDYKSWARGLKAAGYATDPSYPEKLINYIERYNLDQYDNQVLGKKYVTDANQNVIPTEKSGNSSSQSSQYEVQKGDTLYSISKKFTISIEELKKQNTILDNAISVGQILIVE